jgi:DNA modification methylase
MRIDELVFSGQAPADQTPKKRGRKPKDVLPPSELEQKLPKTVDPRNALNDLTSTEWIPETVSVWTQRGLGANHPDAKIERQHPAPFSFSDVARLVRFFTKKGDTVLDPFAGVSSTLKACATEGRKGIGFELNPRFVELSKERLRTEVRDLWAENSQQILLGDARNLIKDLPDNSLDFIATSPPYWNILHKKDHKANQERVDNDLETDYGDDPRDLGNIDNYELFIRELSSILGECARPLKAGKHMAVVVSDFRDKSRYIMFHADLALALIPYGLEMRGLKVLYQRHKRIFPYGYPYAYVPNIHHQFILILQNAKAKIVKTPKSELVDGGAPKVKRGRKPKVPK